MKVEITIRCNRCDALETVLTEAWAQLKTSCGCNGPYRVVERKSIPEEPTQAVSQTTDSPAGNKDAAVTDQAD